MDNNYPNGPSQAFWQDLEQQRIQRQYFPQQTQSGAMAPRQPQGRPGPTASDVGYAGGRLLADTAAATGAAAGVKAGQNHYERTGNWQEAMWLGAIAGRRWMVWTIACGIWLVQILITFGIRMSAVMDSHDYADYPSATTYAGLQESLAMYHAWAWSLPVNFVFLLVLYKRNIDFSLFKQRTIYHAIAPVAGLLNWIPNWILYSGLIVVPVTLQYIF